MIISQQEMQTETILHHYNFLQAIGNLPRTLKTEYTLNGKYNVNKIIPNKNKNDVLSSYGIVYYGIGRKGFYKKNGISYPYRPENTDMDLYDPLPFKSVPEGQSLSEYEKNIYRLPYTKVINGSKITSYYLKKVKIFKAEPDICNVSEDGVESMIDLSSENLFPIPTDQNLFNNLQGNVRHRSVKIEFNHLTITVAEYENLKKYYFPDEDVVVSEFGLYSGYDEPLTQTAYNVQLAFKYCNTGTKLDGKANFSRNIKLTMGNKLLL